VARVRAIVEGQTEVFFVTNVLAPFLSLRGVHLTPILLGAPGHKGGNACYARVKKDILLHLKQDRASCCTTMFDFYGLGSGFPGTPPPNLPNLEKVTQIEQAVGADIVRTDPDLRADVRFVPYLQLHEFEGLLFSDTQAFARGIHQPLLAEALRTIRNQFPTPEDINNDPNTAPSKRVLEVYRSYRKVTDGVLAAQEVGIETMCRECPHFSDWIQRLESLR
jgi:hypothetical protein